MKTLVIEPRHYCWFVALVTLGFLPCTALPPAPTPGLAEPPKAVEPANQTPPNQIGSTDIEAQVYGPGAGSTAAPVYNGKPGTEAGQQCVNSPDQAVMVWVPAGEFLMGRKDGSDSGHRTQPVGSIAADISPYGCLEMVGNVWQWCADWYYDCYYRVAPAKNPPGPAVGIRRVIRGGSWYFEDPYDYRTSYRAKGTTSDRMEFCGFRCCSGTGEVEPTPMDSKLSASEPSAAARPESAVGYQLVERDHSFAFLDHDGRLVGEVPPAAPRWQPHDFSFTTQARPPNPFMISFAATVKGKGVRKGVSPGYCRNILRPPLVMGEPRPQGAHTSSEVSRGDLSCPEPGRSAGADLPG